MHYGLPAGRRFACTSRSNGRDRRPGLRSPPKKPRDCICFIGPRCQLGKADGPATAAIRKKPAAARQSPHTATKHGWPDVVRSAWPSFHSVSLSHLVQAGSRNEPLSRRNRIAIGVARMDARARTPTGGLSRSLRWHPVAKWCCQVSPFRHRRRHERGLHAEGHCRKSESLDRSKARSRGQRLFHLVRLDRIAMNPVRDVVVIGATLAGVTAIATIALTWRPGCRRRCSSRWARRNSPPPWCF